MVCCAVRYCKNSSMKRIKGISFFRFPNDDEVRKKWIELIQKKGWTPTKYSRVCSDHFTEDCYMERFTEQLRLKNDALPSIFLREPSNNVQAPERERVERPLRESQGPCLKEMYHNSSAEMWWNNRVEMNDTDSQQFKNILMLSQKNSLLQKQVERLKEALRIHKQRNAQKVSTLKDILGKQKTCNCAPAKPAFQYRETSGDMHAKNGIDQNVAHMGLLDKRLNENDQDAVVRRMLDAQRGTGREEMSSMITGEYKKGREGTDRDDEATMMMMMASNDSMPYQNHNSIQPSPMQPKVNGFIPSLGVANEPDECTSFAWSVANEFRNLQSFPDLQAKLKMAISEIVWKVSNERNERQSGLNTHSYDMLGVKDVIKLEDL